MCGHILYFNIFSIGIGAEWEENGSGMGAGGNMKAMK